MEGKEQIATSIRENVIQSLLHGFKDVMDIMIVGNPSSAVYMKHYHVRIEGGFKDTADMVEKLSSMFVKNLERLLFEQLPKTCANPTHVIVGRSDTEDSETLPTVKWMTRDDRVAITVKEPRMGTFYITKGSFIELEDGIVEYSMELGAFMMNLWH